MNEKIARSGTELRSHCPIAGLLDIVGDKWTLLVVRDLFMDKHRYSEFQSAPESIPTNILAERLKRLELAGLVRKQYYQERPPRAEYYLTGKGASLAPILRAMRDWGLEYIDGSFVPELSATKSEQIQMPESMEP